MDDPSFYGFPVYGDLHAVKAAEDVGGITTTPHTRTFDINQVRDCIFGGIVTTVIAVSNIALSLGHDFNCVLPCLDQNCPSTLALVIPLVARTF